LLVSHPQSTYASHKRGSRKFRRRGRRSSERALFAIIGRCFAPILV
jgi:hypothetical protein